VQLDAERLRDLEVFSRAELEEIGRRAIDAIASQLDQLDRAMAEPDLEAAADTAHRARNEAQLVGARELGEIFGSLEQYARGGRDHDAHEAAGAARELWPSTREAIARATYGATV
jgi:HPt (histidine-containing phosphotransfer) domain-containing protein